MEYQVKSPIVLIVFNRPELTAQVFNIIRKVKPLQLLVIADGPRPNRPNDLLLIKQTRAIFNQIDWQCELITHFSDSNLGCKLNVSGGIQWVFTQVERAIILEDDILPDISFFKYCDELLEFYHDDERIMMISGSNSQSDHLMNDDSYYFSRNFNIWGWATWRRSFEKYDLMMTKWPEAKKRNVLADLFPYERTRHYWERQFNKVYKTNFDTWDFQWVFTCLINNGLSIVPRVNLVSNIGFGADATHTTDPNSIDSKRVAQAMTFPLNHPPFILPDFSADQSENKKSFSSDHVVIRKIKHLKQSLKRRL